MTKAIRAFVWLMTFDLVVRSIDYITGSDEFVPDDKLPIPEVWGVAGLLTAVILVVGVVRRHNPTLKLGAIVAFSVYLMIAVQLFEKAMLPYPWPPENPRVSVTLLIFSLMWLTVAIVVWWREYIERESEREALGG